jgi:hypothetical protein
MIEEDEGLPGTPHGRVYIHWLANKTKLMHAL